MTAKDCKLAANTARIAATHCRPRGVQSGRNSSANNDTAVCKTGCAGDSASGVFCAAPLPMTVTERSGPRGFSRFSCATGHSAAQAVDLPGGIRLAGGARLSRSVGKHKTQALFGQLGRWMGVATGPAQPLLCAALVLAIFCGSWYVVWRQVRGRVMSSAEYFVTAESLEIPPLPEWIPSDIRAEVLRNASLEGRISALEEDALPRIAAAFSLHPWVEKVRRLAKRAPARVVVELEYRRPVLMVETPAGLLPVDARGILLPSDDFSPVERAGYPRLVGVNSVPPVMPGEPWGDARVVGAAEIAAAIGSAWQELRLSCIAPSILAGSAAPPGEPVYTLVTAEGVKAVWGCAPGVNAPGEPPPAEKIARLRQYLRASSVLDSPGAILDLRRP